MPRSLVCLSFAAITLCMLTACPDSPPPPPPIEYTLHSPYTAVRTFAVAPAVNLSPSRDFDSLKVSDSVYEELQSVDRLNVLPVNKTIAAMVALQLSSINTPQAAAKLADYLNVDAVVVPAVTAYDPYSPPTVGMTLQLYTSSSFSSPDGRQPATQVAAIFNASNQTVLHELAEFAKGRSDYESALQEKRYLADADAYVRFVAHAMVRRLTAAEQVRTGGK